MTGFRFVRYTIPGYQRLAFVLRDVPLFLAVYGFSCFLCSQESLNHSALGAWALTAIWIVLSKLAAFSYFGIDRSWARYVTFHDMISLAKAATTGSVFILLIDFLILPSTTIPRAVFVMDWGFTIMAIAGLRAVARLWKEGIFLSPVGQPRQRVLIVGTNDSGEALLRQIRGNSRLAYHVVGFVGEDARNVNRSIGGVPVIGRLEDTCRLARRHGVNEILITAGELPGERVRELVREAEAAAVRVKVVPSYEQLLKGTIDLRPREVSIEDLLRREPVQLDLARLHRWIDDRVLLVTGSAGSIGSEICRQLLQFSPRKLVFLDHAETGQFYLQQQLESIAPQAPVEVVLGDLTDTVRMEQTFRTYRPDIVFHAAAYKHVPLMERHPCEAVRNILMATRHVADLAHRYECSTFVMVSTDKAVHPKNVMGACKRLAEIYVQALDQQSSCQFVTVRFGNVLDSAGSVVPVFRRQIAAGGPITVTHPKMTRYFMTIPEASQLVLQAGAMGEGGEIFILDMGQPVRILDLAQDMIRLSGLRVDEDIPIRFIGLRPGEKLHEQLWDESEQTCRTSHDKILVTRSQPIPYAGASAVVDYLATLREMEPEMIKQTIHGLVTELSPGETTGESSPEIDEESNRIGPSRWTVSATSR